MNMTGGKCTDRGSIIKVRTPNFECGFGWCASAECARRRSLRAFYFGSHDTRSIICKLALTFSTAKGGSTDMT